MNTLEAIKNDKIIAIVRDIPGTAMLETAAALLAGGINMMEVTFNHSCEAGNHETVTSLRLLHESYPDEILLGAGTVLTSEQVQIAKDCGARYIISPNVDIDVIKKTKELDMISIPGAYTPTETVAAYNAGADIVKLFPAGLLGTAYIKAIRGPLSHIPISAVGGIDETNIAAFLKAGVCCVGIGSNLVNSQMILTGNFKKITEISANLVQAVSYGFK